jgi:nucleotide-binding universal stress UspA family protein
MEHTGRELTLRRLGYHKEMSGSGSEEIAKRREVMEIKTILVPTDFSERSNAAIETALLMAEQVGAKIIFLHSLEWPDHPDEMTPMADAGYAFMKDWANAFLTDLVHQAGSEGLEASAEVVDGVPFLEIIQSAEKHAADLIIMGTHGRTGLQHLMLGSQAERVLRQAPCPVMTIKSSKEILAAV